MRKLMMLTLTAMSGLLSMQPQTPIRIWEGTAEKADVIMTPFLPMAGKACPAVIVCPGGSYFWLDREAEGRKVGEWLSRNGIAAFVLEYRTAGFFEFISHSRLIRRGNRFPDMLCDVQRALQLVREQSGSLRVDSGKIGVMGFSAGGHLALSSGMFFDTDYLSLSGVVPSVSVRPDFVAALYPVVTMTDERYMHRRSRRGLLGNFPQKEMCDSLSLERKAHGKMPPVFIVNCKDDPIVKYQNSELLDSALTVAGVKHKYLQYAVGGHGFGADSDNNPTESAAWMPEFLNWLKTLF